MGGRVFVRVLWCMGSWVHGFRGSPVPGFSVQGFGGLGLSARRRFESLG